MEDNLRGPLLTLEDLCISHRQRPVVLNVSLHVRQKQTVALVGPNGAGKTTILKAIAGLIKPNSGRILLEGNAIDRLSVSEIVHRGVVYVPEGMSVFPDMTVTENLEVGGYLSRRFIPSRMEMVFQMFPELLAVKNSYAGILSGGQQRMITLGRGLMAGAKLLLLDDPFLGLSPKITKRFCETFKFLRRCGVTLFIAGQHVRRILNVSDTAFLIEAGTITLSGPGTKLFNDMHLRETMFGTEESV